MSTCVRSRNHEKQSCTVSNRAAGKQLMPNASSRRLRLITPYHCWRGPGWALLRCKMWNSRSPSPSITRTANFAEIWTSSPPCRPTSKSPTSAWTAGWFRSLLPLSGGESLRFEGRVSQTDLSGEAVYTGDTGIRGTFSLKAVPFESLPAWARGGETWDWPDNHRPHWPTEDWKTISTPAPASTPRRYRQLLK